MSYQAYSSSNFKLFSPFLSSPDLSSSPLHLLLSSIFFPLLPSSCFSSSSPPLRFPFLTPPSPFSLFSLSPFQKDWGSTQCLTDPEQVMYHCYTPSATSLSFNILIVTCCWILPCTVILKIKFHHTLCIYMNILNFIMYIWNFITYYIFNTCFWNKLCPYPYLGVMPREILWLPENLSLLVWEKILKWERSFLRVFRKDC